MENKGTGTIYFASVTQAAIFEHELKGQLSDGMWENALPNDHWKFWCGLIVKIAEPGDEPRVVSPCSWRCKKKGYNFATLYPFIGDRMLALGRMARALAGSDLPFETFSHGEMRGAAEYMPPTLGEWRDCKAGHPLWQYDFVAGYMEHVTDELAQAFYNTRYDMRDLRADISVIKGAMKNIVNG